MKLLSADDRGYQSKKTNNSEIKEALTIKDLRSRSFSQRKQKQFRSYVYLKSPTVPDAIKLWLTKRKAEKIGLSKSKKKSINL